MADQTIIEQYSLSIKNYLNENSEIKKNALKGTLDLWGHFYFGTLLIHIC